MQNFVDVVGTFEEYLQGADWRVKENSNCSFSFGGLVKHVSSKASAKYWGSLYDAVNPEIMQMHNSGDFHIHDLGSFSSYCFGGSLRALILEGIHGVPNIAKSSPAKHLRSICAQIANITTVYQNEMAGAIAFSSVNVYLAPFIYFDVAKKRGLSLNVKHDIEYTKEELAEIKQAVQNMVFQLNSNSRFGAEPAFSNFTLDFKVLEPMKNIPVLWAGKETDLTYSQFQKEADIFLHCFCEVMEEGDGDGKALPYPIPTFNVSKDMQWDSYDDVFAMAAKTGIPYFGNFLHGSLNESDVFSMCCRLRLDMRELQNKTGGLFGAAENTGSIGVLTVNLPAIAYRTKGDKEAFFKDLSHVMDVGYAQLEEKRKVITANLKAGLYPATRTYLKRGFVTFFSSFGLVGAHEMCLNFLGEGVETEAGVLFTQEVVGFMRERIADYQESSKNLYNLEYTPAESTAYRLALKDKKRYPGIIQAGSAHPYYTNSTHLPVAVDWLWADVFKHQEKLLPLATGGSVYHCYLKESISTEAAKKFVKTTLTNYNIPYLSLSPRYSVCDEHGVLKGHVEGCPECGGRCEVYQRVTGYIRKVSSFNNGKAEEYNERFQR
jgi:ribonucleoside-triphosphate reductase